MSIQIDILLSGFPGRTNRGALGFCTVTLIKSNKLILYDTGHYADRIFLLQELKKRNLSPEDIEMVVLSHLHFDHCLNIDLFKNAEIVLSKNELKYALSDEPEKAGDHFIPKCIIPMIEKRTFIDAKEKQEIAENVYIMKTPGHTPGSISLYVDCEGKKTAIVGDAVKNAWEFLRGFPEQVFGEIKEAVKSIKKIRKLDAIIIPGHDAHFVFEEEKNKIRYLTKISLELMFKFSPYTDEWHIYHIP